MNSPTQINVRRLSYKDSLLCYELSSHILAKLKKYYPKEIIDRYDSTLQKEFTRILINERTHILGAFIDNEPAGLAVGRERAGLLHIEFLGSIHGGWDTERQLLNSLEAIAQSKNLYRVYLATSAKNTEDISFFIKSGYGVDWRMRNYWYGWHYVQLSKQIHSKDWGEIDLSPDFNPEASH